MLPSIDRGTGEPTLVFMHLFGSARREWTECMAILSTDYRCIALDLPGFGEASDMTGYSVEQMVDAVEKALRALHLKRFVLVGHSLSGKVALVIASRTWPKMAGLILVAPSPPSPEPIDDESRKKMLAMKRDRASAETFLDGITDKPLSGEMRERSILDFIRCSPAAWTAWLETGSREDWKDRVGIVNCPTLVVAGSEDPSLSAPVQKQTTMKSLGRARLEIMQNCGHLPTMENPERLSALILDFLSSNLA